MIPATALAYLQALEDAMAKLPTKTKGLKGTPVGKSYDAIADEMGKMLIKPKRKPAGQTLNQQYASKSRKKWKGVAK